MSGPFLFLTRPGGGPVDADTCRAFDAVAARNELPPLTWVHETDYAVALGPDAAGLGTGPSLTRGRWAHVLSNARLDNPAEIAGLAHPELRGSLATDPERVAGAIDVCGARCIPQLLGDFALVAWFPASRELHAARDAFGVRTLYYTERKDLFALSSNAALLAEGERYDREFMIDYLCGHASHPSVTAFAGVKAIEPGCRISRKDRHMQAHRYWSALSFSIDPSAVDADQIERFRAILLEAIKCRLTLNRDCWAHLSGGLDSSSIVSGAEWLVRNAVVRNGIVGTVTVVDNLGHGDEREYVSAVLSQSPIQNRQIIDDWMWRDDGEPPPITDTPHPGYPFFARDRSIRQLVRDSGGQTILSGEGADQYLTGSLIFLADMIRGGELLAALKALRHWSKTLRRSYWGLGFRYGLYPLLPPLPKRIARRQPNRPVWLQTERPVSRQTHISPLQSQPQAKLGHYASEIEYLVSDIWRVLVTDIFDSSLEIRYPFLDRRLVELSLTLPPHLRSRPLQRKYILREAMRGLLPEAIRLRSGKGGVGARIPWSIARERKLIDGLLRDSLIADLNYVDLARLRDAVHSSTVTRVGTPSPILRPLSLETWLRVRSGQWTAGDDGAGVHMSGEQQRSSSLSTAT